MTQIIRKLTAREAQLHSLAPVIQRWAELCKQQAKNEPVATLRWYLIGRSDAHAMDAHRVRETLSPTTTLNPPDEGVAFVNAYEALLNMMRAMSPEPPTQTPDTPE